MFVKEAYEQRLKKEVQRSNSVIRFEQTSRIQKSAPA